MKLNRTIKETSMMESNEGYGFVSGLFIGATLGAMAALLLAPKSGREVRAELYAGGERLRSRASTKASELVGRGEAVIETAKDAARETADNVKRGASRLLRKTDQPTEDRDLSSSSYSSAP
jgi:gas vesicle protein